MELVILELFLSHIYVHKSKTRRKPRRVFFIAKNFNPVTKKLNPLIETPLTYVDTGNSYAYYDPMRLPMYPMARGGGYARTSSKEEMISELQKMMDETNDEKVRAAIQEAITKMNK